MEGFIRSNDFVPASADMELHAQVSAISHACILISFVTCDQGYFLWSTVPWLLQCVGCVTR